MSAQFCIASRELYNGLYVFFFRILTFHLVWQSIKKTDMLAHNCLFDRERLKLRNIFETVLVHYLH